jgi:CHAD domain-containing protein
MARFLEQLEIPAWDLDPEGLHQVRVAARRLGAVMDLVDPEAYTSHKRHRRSLKGLVKALGPIRELDVHAEALQAQRQSAATPVQVATLEHLLENLARLRAKAHRAMKKEVATLHLQDLPRLLKVSHLSDPFQTTSLQEAAWMVLAPRLAVLHQMPDLARQEDAAALHKSRVQIKKLRYALEALEGAFAEPPEAILLPLRQLQTCLGTHHDLAALEGWLWEQEARLREQDRVTLCGTVLDLLGAVAEDRRAAFDQFTHQVKLLHFPELVDALHHRLGLPPLEAPPA